MKYNRIFIIAILLGISSIGFSQNTGPNSTDHTSYWAVNPKGMIDLPTGDFIYSVPLIEVPGPEGSYPITLTYHAGITKDQEASWVGLGWSLTPGAITRTVNGVPDDWKNKKVNHILSLVSNNDDYTLIHGYGMGGYASVGLQYTLGFNRNISGYKKREWKEYQQGVKFCSGTLYMNGAGQAINQNSDFGGSEQSTSHMMDVYSLPYDLENNTEDDLDERENNNCMMFPDYDEYRVSGPGLTGTITPHIFECGTLLGDGRVMEMNDEQTQVDKKLVYHYDSGDDLFEKTHSEIYFYFDNVHNSFLRINTDDFSNASDPVKNYTYNGGSLIHEIPEDFREEYDAYTNYNSTDKRKGAAKHIEWFTNYDIENDGTVYDRGFIETEDISGSRTDNTYFDPDGIGAFCITTEDGTTYHYSLPVYQYEQFFRDELINNPEFYEKRQLEKYAYTWLLTAITGSDFVDNEPTGYVGDEDYGYWIKFSYGKWSDGYIWRTPYQDGNEYSYDQITHQTHYWGRKQVYYLNSIQTRSHTAYFIKWIREDGKGKLLSTTDDFTGRSGVPLTVVENDFYSENSESNWTPDYSTRYDQNKKYRDELDIPQAQQLLKLNKIILVDNDYATLSCENNYNLVSLPNESGNMEFYEEIEITDQALSDVLTKTTNKNFRIYYQDNVLDKYDDLGDIEDNAIQVVEFTHDYSLLKYENLPNSPYLMGRLTLTEVEIKGEGGGDAIPSYEFTYNNDNVNFDLNFEQGHDEWGFFETKRENWSLSKIVKPLGGEINITYEPDDFYSRAALNIDMGISAIPEVNIGGGIRVSEIQIDDDEGNVYKTTYKYNIPEATNDNDEEISSGVTSYIPLWMQSGYQFEPIPYVYELPCPRVLYQFVTLSQHGADAVKGDNDEYDKYESETLYIFDVLKSSRYEDYTNWSDENFKVDEYIKIENANNELELGTCSENGTVYMRNSTIRNNLGAIGRMSGYLVKNAEGHTLEKTFYDYADTSEIRTGMIQETFRYHKRYYENTDESYSNTWYLNSSSRITYPSVLKGILTIKNGAPAKTEFTKYDFNTGMPVEISSGGSKKILVPAYKIFYELDGETEKYTMGSKLSDPENKNMLTQVAATYSANKNGMVTSAGIQTWKNEWTYRIISYDNYTDGSPVTDVWRKHKIFTWKGEINNNGTYNNFDILDADDSDDEDDWSIFDSDDQETLGNWYKTIEITRYNHYSIPLESKDMNDSYSAGKLGYSECHAIASAVNSNYCSFAYTGFEDRTEISGSLTSYDGEVLDKNNYTTHMVSPDDPDADSENFITGITPHSGRYYVRIRGGDGPEYRALQNNMIKGTYRASVWVHKDSDDGIKLEVLKVNGQSSSQISIEKDGDFTEDERGYTVEAGDWVLLNLDFDIGISTASDYVRIYVTTTGCNNCDAFVDDLRIYPIDATVTSTVYDQNTSRVSAVLNANNFTTYYEYDDAGRVEKVYQETSEYGKQLVKENDYHYVREE